MTKQDKILNQLTTYLIYFSAFFAISLWAIILVDSSNSLKTFQISKEISSFFVIATVFSVGLLCIVQLILYGDRVTIPSFFTKNNLATKLKRNKIFHTLKLSIIVIFLALLSVFSGGLIVNKGNVAQTFNETLGMIKGIQKVTATTPEPTPTLIPLPTSAPLELGDKGNTYVNPDPIVNCVMTTDCGGGSKSLTKSQCANSVCCNFAPGNNVFYLDRKQCDIDQAKYNQSHYYVPQSNIDSSTINKQINNAILDVSKASAAQSCLNFLSTEMNWKWAECDRKKDEQDFDYVKCYQDVSAFREEQTKRCNDMIN